jgi:hypothetical protein
MPDIETLYSFDFPDDAIRARFGATPVTAVVGTRREPGRCYIGDTLFKYGIIGFDSRRPAPDYVFGEAVPAKPNGWHGEWTPHPWFRTPQLAVTWFNMHYSSATGDTLVEQFKTLGVWE